MATGLMIAGAASSIAAGISGYRGGKKAAKEAKELGKLNASLVMLETEQEIKNIERTGEQVRGDITAQAGGSGVRKTGTVTSILDQAREATKEATAWAKTRGDIQKDIARKGGSAAASTAKSQAQQSLLRGTAGAASGVYRAGSSEGWWN